MAGWGWCGGCEPKKGSAGKLATPGKHSPGLWPFGICLFVCIGVDGMTALQEGAGRLHVPHVCAHARKWKGTPQFSSPQSEDHLLPILVQGRRWEGEGIVHGNDSPVDNFYVQLQLRLL